MGGGGGPPPPEVFHKVLNFLHAGNPALKLSFRLLLYVRANFCAVSRSLPPVACAALKDGLCDLFPVKGDFLPVPLGIVAIIPKTSPKFYAPPKSRIAPFCSFLILSNFSTVEKIKATTIY